MRGVGGTAPGYKRYICHELQSMAETCNRTISGVKTAAVVAVVVAATR